MASTRLASYALRGLGLRASSQRQLSPRRCFCKVTKPTTSNSPAKPGQGEATAKQVGSQVEAKAGAQLESKSSAKVTDSMSNPGPPGNVNGPASAKSRRPPSAPPKSPITWLSLAVTAVVGGGTYLLYQSEKEKQLRKAVSQEKVIGKAALGGPFTLVEMSGRPVTDKDYLGKYLLIYFGFSRCPDICPSELVKMGNVLDRLGSSADKIQPLYISVDPHRDSLLQLKQYAKDFHEKIMFLTGTPAQCLDAAKVYRVYHNKADAVDEDNYLVDHSIVMYFVGPDGEFIDFFTQSTTAADIVSRMRAQTPDLSR